MALSNADRVARALDALAAGLLPFVERELAPRYEDEEWYIAAATRPGRPSPNTEEVNPGDVSFLLGCLKSYWDRVFSKTLSRSDRTLVFELSDHRNAWAHQEPFSTDDAYRALDSAERLLRAVAASDEAAEVNRLKQELMRRKFAEEARSERRKQTAIATEGEPAAGLTPWREIVTPHKDVASGRYQQAEFAADLAQVHRGEASAEYGESGEFFRRTFITDGLHKLLRNALLRLTSSGGDPVVDLQTNFGGGKTHSMLALYHLFGAKAPAELTGVDSILSELGIEDLPRVARAVIVGTGNVDPAKPRIGKDGVERRTLWGELGWQLGGREAYDHVAQADATGTAPSAETLVGLFRSVGACLILIDEWVAYARQLYGIDGLPAGSFDAHFSFAQALTEAAKQCKDVLLVASIPASDIEIGGEGGQAALERLTNVVKRMESPWSPATAEEGFEIVRRRLFEDISSEDARKRDAVVKAFSEMYRSYRKEFPNECGEGEFERRMQAAYPIHPSLFDVLYNEWSTLDRFQRTRGVLRLMAAVIHELWERQDASLLIMPSTIPMDAAPVQDELLHYVEQAWKAIIERDVDGPQSVPLRLDRNNPNLGRYSATRRVSRSVYLGSAPTHQATNRGILDQAIKLSCVQPGEAPATFGDALRRLTDQATHLYVDGQRYWFSTQPSVLKTAKDRANQVKDDDVEVEIVRRLRLDTNRGPFAGMHVAPDTTADVQDEDEVRLVVLHPEHSYDNKAEISPAKQFATETLEKRGNSPRRYRNMLLFLAPDKTRLGELTDAVRQYLAWKSIDDDKAALNLDHFQMNQVETKRAEADDTVKHRVLETYQWALVPTQPEPTGDIVWEAVRVPGTDAPAERIAKKLATEESFIPEFSGVRLRLELDRVLWRDADHVSVKQLWEWFASYLYLPRLRDQQVLLEAVHDGLGVLTWHEDTFAYADAYDGEKERYRGLKAGQRGGVVADGSSVLVKPAIAAAQMQLEKEATTAGNGAATYTPGTDTSVEGEGGITEEVAAGPRRFYGVVSLDADKLAKSMMSVSENVIVHLQGVVGAKLRLTLEVEADIPEGAPDHVVRTVTENARTLGFDDFSFERE